RPAAMPVPGGNQAEAGRAVKSRPRLAKSRETAAAEDGLPRYVQVGRQLTADLADGRFPDGSQLPTEMQLCKKLNLSRFTAREAIRLLVDQGLVARRQRVGTIVVATPDQTRYTLALSSLGDLLQYAQNTELVLSDV